MFDLTVLRQIEERRQQALQQMQQIMQRPPDVVREYHYQERLYDTPEGTVIEWEETFVEFHGFLE